MFNWKAEIEGDRIRLLGEEYPLGHFCLELLQPALVDDAAQRVSILWAFLEPTLHELQNGLIIWKRSNSSACLQTWGRSCERQQQDVLLFRSDR